MLSQKSFKSYIHRVLKQVHPDTNITRKAMECTDGIIRTVATRICDDAHMFTHGTDKKTLSSREVQSAVHSTLPGELSKHAVREGTTACTKYADSVAASDAASKKKRKKSPTAPVMREFRAGLVMSVSLAEKYLRGFGQIKYNIAAASPVYLAAVLDYLVAEIMEAAGNVCRDHKRTNITVRHLFLAVHNDDELSRMLHRFNVVILGGGVLPNINARLLVKKPKKTIRRKKVEGEAKRPHKWRPGTVALREIKNFQKSSGLLMQHAPFERLVREVSGSIIPDLRFTHEFMTAFQSLVEHDTVNLLHTANDLCCHANRETVQVADIDLAVALRHLPTSSLEPENEVPTAAVNKLAYRAGIKRIGTDAKDRTQAYIVAVMEHYMTYVLLCAQHNRRQTINTKFLLEGLTMCGVCLATIPEKRRIAKVGGLSRSNSQASDADSVYSPSKETHEEFDEDKVKAVAKRGRGGKRSAVAEADSDPEEEEILEDLEEESDDDLVSE